MRTFHPAGQKRKAETMTVFGEKVKNRRAELRIDQDRLADLCGVSRRTIVSYETQGKYPREATLRKLASALGVTERYLMNDEETDPSAGINEEPFIQEARDAFGKKGAEEMAAVLSRNEALFAGGTLSEDQKDMFYEAVTKAYFMSKKRAREKFGKKKTPEKEFPKEFH
jgi:transcriptional regulator with XRE-family HTH domain